MVAAESAFFVLAFVNIGLVPDGGSTAILPARVGAARAFEMALLGERVPAATALDWGLVNRVVPDAELEQSAQELLAKLAAGPTRAYANGKRLLNRSLYPGLAEQLEAEAEAQLEQGRHDRLHRGRARLRREAAAELHRQLNAATARGAGRRA